MVLRGIWLCTPSENDYFLNGGSKTHFPEVWQRFSSMVPKRYRKKPISYYWKMMNSKNQKTAYKFCREWAIYEFSLCHLEYNVKNVMKETRGKWVVAFAKIETQYLRNDCFLPRNYILRNIRKIKNIPLSIVHGRYDFVCIPSAAYSLHKALPKSKLFYVTAGHAASDPEMRKRMVKEIHQMAKRF